MLRSVLLQHQLNHFQVKVEDGAQEEIGVEVGCLQHSTPPIEEEDGLHEIVEVAQLREQCQGKEVGILEIEVGEAAGCL
jgi:hypothetical protein